MMKLNNFFVFLILTLSLFGAASSAASQRTTAQLNAMCIDLPNDPKTATNYDLEDYFDCFVHFHPMKLMSVSDRFENIDDLLKENEQRYALFYEGPEDNGDSDQIYDNFNQQVAQRIEKAHAFVNNVLMVQPAETINLFMITILQKYFENAYARPAIKDIIQALANIEFNDTREFERALERSNLYQFTTGAAIGGIGGAGLVCIFRPSRCNQALRAVSRRSRITSRMVRDATPDLSELSVTRRLIRRVRRAAGLKARDGRLLSESLATVAAKDAFWKRYAKYRLKDQIVNMAMITGAGGVAGSIYMGIQKARRENKAIEEILNPAELEQVYYSSLAVLDLTCKARRHLNNSEIEARTLKHFVVSAHEEMLFLGRMAGGIRVLDARTPLEFVTPLPEQGKFIATIPLKDKKIRIQRDCPEIASFGTPVSVMLSELENRLFPALIEKYRGLSN